MDRLQKFEMLNKQLQSLDLPIAYYAFREPVNPPFMVYYSPHVNNFVADNKIYMQQDFIELELYTDKKDLVLEERVRQLLTSNGYIYDQYEVYLPDEKMFMITFHFEI